MVDEPQETQQPSRPPDFSGIEPPQDPKVRKRSRVALLVLIAGVLMFIVGVGPLIVTLLMAALGWTSDPNPNPVGLGILAACMVWPSITLVLTGVVMLVVARMRK